MNTLRRKYRRFRLYNESSRPGLLRLIDSIVGLLKILLLLTLLGAIYLLLQDSPLDFFSSEKETEPASNVAESSAIIRTAAQLSRNTVDANPSASPARVAGPDAILNLNDSGYIIQYKSSTDYAELLDFASRLPQASTAAIFPYKRDRSNRVTYGLASGVYDTFQSAMRQVKQLPESLIEDEPWIRSVPTLKRDIESFN